MHIIIVSLTKRYFGQATHPLLPGGVGIMNPDGPPATICGGGGGANVITPSYTGGAAVRERSSPSFLGLYGQTWPRRGTGWPGLEHLLHLYGPRRFFASDGVSVSPSSGLSWPFDGGCERACASEGESNSPGVPAPCGNSVLAIPSAQVLDIVCGG